MRKCSLLSLSPVDGVLYRSFSVVRDAAGIRSSAVAQHHALIAPEAGSRASLMLQNPQSQCPGGMSYISHNLPALIPVKVPGKPRGTTRGLGGEIRSY